MNQSQGMKCYLLLERFPSSIPKSQVILTSNSNLVLILYDIGDVHHQHLIDYKIVSKALMEAKTRKLVV